MSTTPWLSWVADYIPEEVHGRFWGKRTAWIAAIMIIALVSAAFLMDRTQERWKLELTVIIFIAATIFGLLDLIIHGTIPEPPMAKPPENSFLQEILLPIRDAELPALAEVQPGLVFHRLAGRHARAALLHGQPETAAPLSSSG